MRQVEVSRQIEARPDAVWQVLADFPNIAAWNSGVKTSYATGTEAGGVGATRHCDLAPIGSLEETVRAWEPETRMAISIDSAKRIPVKRGQASFDLSPAATGEATVVDLTYEYDTKFGPVGRLMGPLIDKQLTKGFAGFLADLEAAAVEG